MLAFELVRDDETEVAVRRNVERFGTVIDTLRTGSLSKASELRLAARKQLMTMIVLCKVV